MGNQCPCIMLPRLAAIERAADEDAIASCALRPVIRGAELVKSDVTQDGVACGIVRQGDVSGDTVHSWHSSLRYLPCLSAVFGKRHACRHLPGNHRLLRIFWIHGDGWLVEVTGFGSYVDNMGVRSGWQLLREEAAGASYQQQK